MSLAPRPDLITPSLQPSLSQASAMPSLQPHNQPTTSSTTSSPLSSLHHSDTDSDLSSAPASPPHSDTDSSLSSAPPSPLDLRPIPTTLTTPTHPLNPPSPDTDSDLSSAPSSPIWPGSPTPPRCTEPDCPVRKVLRVHYKGRYQHENTPPGTEDTLFRSSNPPPEIWKSWMRLLDRDAGSTVEDDWNVLGFLRWHVEDPDTCFMGSWVSEGRKPVRRA